LKVRRRARILALQALFEVDTVHHNPDLVLRGRVEESPISEAGEHFSKSLLHGVLEHQDVLDTVIQRIAPEWPIQQMAPVDRNILRMAAYEIILGGSTPPKVVINEAVELAKAFGSDSSSRFVNGVLGTLLAHKHDLTATLPIPPIPAVISATHDDVEEPDEEMPYPGGHPDAC
jgi:transcription antitermination protein NusB